MILTDGENGFLVPVGDPTPLPLGGMTVRLLELLANPRKARIMGERGRLKFLERYSQERNIPAHAGWYLERIAEAGR